MAYEDEPGQSWSEELRKAERRIEKMLRRMFYEFRLRQELNERPYEPSIWRSVVAAAAAGILSVSVAGSAVHVANSIEHASQHSSPTHTVVEAQAPQQDLDFADPGSAGCFCRDAEAEIWVCPVTSECGETERDICEKVRPGSTCI